MAKLDKEKWLSSDTYDFEQEGAEFYAVKSKPSSLIKVIKEVMPEGSFTKFIRNKLRGKNLL